MLNQSLRADNATTAIRSDYINIINISSILAYQLLHLIAFTTLLSQDSNCIELS